MNQIFQIISSLRGNSFLKQYTIAFNVYRQKSVKDYPSFLKITNIFGL